MKRSRARATSPVRAPSPSPPVSQLMDLYCMVHSRQDFTQHLSPTTRGNSGLRMASYPSICTWFRRQFGIAVVPHASCHRLVWVGRPAANASSNRTASTHDAARPPIIIHSEPPPLPCVVTTPCIVQFADRNIRRNVTLVGIGNFSSSYTLEIQLQSRWMSSSRRHLPFRECRSLEEAIHLAYDNLNHATPRNLSAFWAVVPKHLRNGHNSGLLGQNPGDLMNQLDQILGHTLERIGSFDYRDLAQTTLGLAKIVDWISRKRGGKVPTIQPLHDLFIGNNSENKQFIFAELAVAA